MSDEIRPSRPDYTTHRAGDWLVANANLPVPYGHALDEDAEIEGRAEVTA